MRSTCIIRRWDGTTATNPNTGAVTKNTTTVYPLPPLTGSGKCRVQLQSSLAAQNPQAGETQLAVIRPEIHLPLLTSTGLRTGDVATITAVDPVSGDPDLVEKKLRIEVPFHKDDATARRLPCTEGGFDG